MLSYWPLVVTADEPCWYSVFLPFSAEFSPRPHAATPLLDSSNQEAKLTRQNLACLSINWRQKFDILVDLKEPYYVFVHIFCIPNVLV